MKLKGEVGMGGPKRTQTRFVHRDNDVHYTNTSLRLLFSINYHEPVHLDSLVLSLTERN